MCNTISILFQLFDYLPSFIYVYLFNVLHTKKEEIQILLNMIWITTMQYIVCERILQLFLYCTIAQTHDDYEYAENKHCVKVLPF